MLEPHPVHGLFLKWAKHARPSKLAPSLYIYLAHYVFFLFFRLNFFKIITLKYIKNIIFKNKIIFSYKLLKALLDSPS